MTMGEAVMFSIAGGYPPLVRNLNIAFFTLSLACNLICTGLIGWKAWQVFLCLMGLVPYTHPRPMYPGVSQNLPKSKDPVEHPR